VTLTGLDGREIAHQRVEFTPHSQRRVEVNDLLAAVVSAATTGRISAMQSPNLKGMAITAQLSLTYLGSQKPNYVDEEIAMPSAKGSQSLRAVADASDGSPLIAITSLAQTGQHILVECLGEDRPKFSKSVDLLAEETLVTEACVDRTVHGGDFETVMGSASQGPHGPVGIVLTSDAMPGSFAAFGLSPHRKQDGRFFSAMTFADPKMVLSATTVFTGVPVGSATLLPDGKYVPQLALANFSSNDLHVRIKYAETSGSTPTVQEAGNTIVPARSSKGLTLGNLQGDLGLQNSFLIISDGAPGDLMAKLVSTSESSLREVESLGKDEKDSMNGGNHPWSIEQGGESTLLLFNHSEAVQEFSVTISGDTAVWQKTYRLVPMQTEAISIRSPILGQVQDERGRVLPRDILTGQLSWFTHLPGKGKGRILQSNRESAMARNFSCGSTYVLCGAQFGAGTTTFPIGSQGVAFGYAVALVCIPQEYGQPCSGQGAGPDNFNYTYTWSSDSPNVISIAGTSFDGLASHVTVNGLAVGTANVSVRIYDPNNGCYAAAGGAGNVQPTVTFSGPGYGPLRTGSSTGPNSANYTSTVNPSGGTYSWSVSNGNVTLTNTSSATVTATAANQSSQQSDTTLTLKYTYNNQSSIASANITVVKPSSLASPPTTDTPNPSGHTCTAGYGNPTCSQSGFTGTGSYTSYVRNRTYRILDQFNNWIAGYPLDIGESYSSPTGQCASDAVTTSSGAGDTVTDCFYFCSATCKQGGTCGVSATQTITVNGYSVRTESVTWTCSSVSLSPR